MHTITAIAKFTGFARATLDKRVVRYGLTGKKFSVKDLLQLRPLDEAHSNKISLEEARTKLTIEQTRGAKYLADERAGELAPVGELIDINNTVFENIAAAIRKDQDLSEDRKREIFDLIQDGFRAFEDSMKAKE